MVHSYGYGKGVKKKVNKMITDSVTVTVTISVGNRGGPRLSRTLYTLKWLYLIKNNHPYYLILDLSDRNRPWPNSARADSQH